ncbi:olfactory receptor 5V1-like [Pseudophryne corroboree]|uniref:olfactory receptor 5V1-like n=1 Tax=Pseudophryne corroboree TaxID=495146 RepID=UPI00308205BD
MEKTQDRRRLQYFPNDDSSANASLYDGFILLGLTTIPALQTLILALFAVTYIMTVAGNLMIIIIISLDIHLHSPMYFFLVHLAFLELLYTTTLIPNTLRIFLDKKKNISFVGCLTQMFTFITLGGSECVLLGTMAYDRYVAICQPLHYHTIMNPKCCLHLALTCWCSGFLNSLLHTILTSMLPFCNDRHVKHYFCEIPSILKLSCKDTFMNELLIFLFGGSMTVGSLILILVSYTCIIAKVLRIPGRAGKHKMFSTCISHLIVVSIFFGTVIHIYIRPTSQTSSDQNRVISVVYGVVTPLFNPIIYSFRNSEFQRSFQKLLIFFKAY